MITYYELNAPIATSVRSLLFISCDHSLLGRLETGWIAGCDMTCAIICSLADRSTGRLSTLHDRNAHGQLANLARLIAFRSLSLLADFFLFSGERSPRGKQISRPRLDISPPSSHLSCNFDLLLLPEKSELFRCPAPFADSASTGTAAAWLFS